ncbi:MAG: 3'(2'),5'-bisphosphate nucleotidase CysQ, partial [Candidatus Berkiella sp.]
MISPLAQWTLYAYNLAVQAGEKIMHYYAQSTVATEYKSDNSPLTAADKASHEILYQGLSQFILDANGAAPVLSEEGEQIPFVERQRWQRYWCIDPLDGTREFLDRNDEFAVNIALIENHQPIIGIIYVPAKKLGYRAWHNGGAYRCDEKNVHRIITKHPAPQPLRIAISRHYEDTTLQPWLVNLGDTQILRQGSAWKFGCLAS